MLSDAVSTINKSPEYAYHLLRGALESFQKSVSELTDSQIKKAKLVADKTFALESIVLSAPEAVGIIVPDSKLETAFGEVKARYADEDSFLNDLESNGLDEEVLRRSLHRELLFDAVMERVTTKTPEVSDIDIQLFYQIHLDRFTRPEKRKARHILITINPDFVENDRQSAFENISMLAEKLMKNPSRFEALAKKHSECPTAMEGGRLGELTTGILYPELDTALFAMEEGEISQPIESEMGFHILLCEKINKAVTVPLSRAKPQVKQLLQERQRKACQKAWLEKLQEDIDG